MKSFDVDDFERRQEDVLEAAFRERRLRLEQERLQRCQARIADLQKKAATSELTSRQQVQLVKLRDEQDGIVRRMQDLVVVVPTSSQSLTSLIEKREEQLPPPTTIKEGAVQSGPEEEETAAHAPTDNRPVDELFEDERCPSVEPKSPLEADVTEETEDDDEGEYQGDDYRDDSTEEAYVQRLTSAGFMLDVVQVLQLPLPDQLHLNSRLPCVSVLDKLYAYGPLWEQLFSYQRQGLFWLLRRYLQHSGGILGDEMGLGKCVQTVGFLSSLALSGLLDRPALVIAPTTLLRQWVSEVHVWAPFMRVHLLHHQLARQSSDKAVLREVFARGHVVVTSYGYLRQHPRHLTAARWKVVVLDEGHGIRNPSTRVSGLCRQLRTDRRFILSGTPIQNDLMELWTLMDFCQPSLLGSAFDFRQAFAEPIRAGGFLNATNQHVAQAQKCAVLLRERLEPFLLRRLKSSVAQQLPRKTEKLILCPLTAYQRRLYDNFLRSDDIQLIYAKRKNALFGIDVLRKICNHPALLRLSQADDDDNDPDYDKNDRKEERILWSSSLTRKEEEEEGEATSGKMVILRQVLQEWRHANDKVLLFCQTRQMLDLVQAFIVRQGYPHLRMDGRTPVSQRTALIDQFNADAAIYVFLLTTRVGGLGLNLTGANRVVIVDPDWNPSTDLQARERAWRLGQRRDVLVYRLLAGEGSIEEKIFQRQVFKQYLTKKILQDPAYASRVFSRLDLHDLFSPLDSRTMRTREELDAAADDHHNEDIVDESRGEETAYSIEQDILQTCQVSAPEPPAREAIKGVKARLMQEQTQEQGRSRLEQINADRQRLVDFLKQCFLKHPNLSTKAIIGRVKERPQFRDVDPVALKQALRSIARFDQAAHSWQLYTR
jgi:DNA excision repair protein ERCC-6